MSTQQSKHWADKIALGILRWQEKNTIAHLHVDDMKTPSGRVHTGALRGVVLHDLVAAVLREHRSQSLTSTYVFNDMDPMDGLPAYLPKEKYEQHMGKPLHTIPAPTLEESGIDFSQTSEEDKKRYRDAKSFGEFYALDFIDAFRVLGCSQEILWSHELYESGKMDEQIRTALNSVQEIRAIYKEVADYELPPNWYPFQVICPQCGKVGTTLTTNWDGVKVTFECQPNKVEWATGCGHIGTISPFGGTGKLLWKVDWPAHWSSIGVTVEGAGKDHTSAGGSRDMANQLCNRIFNITPPFDIPYEWILVRGAKMSSSKGVGTSAREFVQLFPPAVGRFLFVSKDYNQVIDFDPQTMSIPDLFDEFDLGAHIYWGQEKGDHRLGRAFSLSYTDIIPEAHFLPRFRDLAIWMQHPEIELEKQFADVKGAPLTAQELGVLEERKQYAKVWVERFAPEEFQLQPKTTLPEAAKQLSPEQITYLQLVDKLLETKKDWEPQELQQQLFELAKASIGPRKAFAALYLAFLGKTAGPRAAWLLLSISPDLRRKRISELSGDRAKKALIQPQTNTGSISDEVRAAFPGIFFAEITISGVTIQKSSDQLMAFTKELVESLSHLTTQEIGQMKSIQAYRALFKATGTNFHSKRPSPEALLRRVASGKDLYQVNTAVDAYNLAVLETGIGLGGFDADELRGNVALRFSKAGEKMLLLGDDTKTVCREGQLVYADQQQPITIDLNYRDINATKITEKTSTIRLFADGAPGLESATVVAALEKGAAYITKYCGGKISQVKLHK
jgi:lysyl-tRNA synthetase, class I